jgi:hypothetical protein
MPLSRTRRVQKLIDRINTELDQQEWTIYWYGATPEKRIFQAERMIGKPFPASFRYFLETVGGGGIESFSILGVPAKGNIRHSGSVFGYTDHWREDWVPEKIPEHLLVIQHCEDNNEPFCLDFSRLRRGECPVVLYYPWNGGIEDIAPSFIDFWEVYCEPRIAASSNTSMTPPRQKNRKT